MYIFYPFRLYHKLIVGQWLYLQIIIKIHDPGKFRLLPAVQQRFIQLPGLAGASNDQSLPVLKQFALRDPWPSAVIIQMGFADQRIQIGPAHIVLCQNDHMICGHLLNDLGIGFSRFLKLRKALDPFFREHF